MDASRDTRFEALIAASLVISPEQRRRNNLAPRAGCLERQVVEDSGTAFIVIFSAPGFADLRGGDQIVPDPSRIGCEPFLRARRHETMRALKNAHGIL